MNWPKKITIKEVGPRDGLQNEPSFISTKDKIDWINQLSRSGLSYIEITSFVHPKWIPALADALEVARGIERVPGTKYAALVPNLLGLERALTVNIDEVAVFISASETHNYKNINRSINQSLEIISEVVSESLAAGKSVRGYISTVFGCPYEGEVPIKQVMTIAETLFSMGVGEISLGDTIGVANPKTVHQLLEKFFCYFPVEKLALHFHDTRGLALANVLTAVQMGVTTFDSSLGGLGGCPYAPGASGNLATDDLVYMLESMGIDTGIDFQTLHKAGLFIQEKIGRPLPSHSLKVVNKERKHFY